MVTVDEILQITFRSLSKNSKFVKQIMREDKPRPPLRNLRSMNVNYMSDGSKTVVLTIFDDSTYDQVEWMTGCEKRQSLFCWPCLLFSAEASPWNTKGVSQLTCLRDTLKAHEKSCSHIKAMLDWHLYRQQPNLQSSIDVFYQNELIKRNREVVRRIIDVVCSLIMQQRPPRSGCNIKNHIKIEDCLESMSLLREYDVLQCNVIDDALDVMQITPNIVNDIVDSITSVLKASIKKEALSSSYVSIILSEHSDDITRSQISAVLRYLKEGKVCERFVGFTNLEKTKSDISPLECIIKVADAFQIKPRLIGIALDGSTVKCDKHTLQKFKRSFPSVFPYSFFVPCYFHKMEHVLEQSLCIHKELDSFFKHLKGMGTYLKDSRIRSELESFENGLLVDIETFESMKYPELFENVKATRNIFLSFYDSILKNCEKWTSSHLMRATCFRHFLMNFKTVFLIEVFIKLYNLIQDFSDTLKSETPENAFHCHVISNLLKSLQDIKDNGFGELWKSVYSSFQPDDLSQLKKPQQKNYKLEDKSVCLALFLDIVTCFQLQLSSRFEFPLTLEFFHILNSEMTSIRKIKDCVQKLNERGSFVVEAQIFPELHMLSKVLKSGSKSVYDLLQFFREKGLRSSFENLYKLSELILSLPCKPPSAAGGGPVKLDKIIPWTYTSRKDFTGDTSVLCVERDYFQELRKGASFYDDVIAKFLITNKTMELEYYV